MKNLKQNSKNSTFFEFTKSTIIFMILLVFMASCVKNEDIDKDKPGEYMISFKANGVLQEFTSDHSPKYGLIDYETQHIAVVTGTRPSGSVAVQAIDGKPIIAKIYSGNTLVEGTVKSDSYAVGAFMHYNDGQIDYTASYLADRDMTIQILEMTSKIVRGTFKGTLKSTGKPDLIITDGKFNVPIGELSPT